MFLCSFTYFNPKLKLYFFISTIIHKTPPISFWRKLNSAKQNRKVRLVTNLWKTQYFVGLSLIISLWSQCDFTLFQTTEKPLYLRSEYADYPRSMFSKWLLWSENSSLLPLSFLIFDLLHVHCAVHLIISCRWTAVYPNCILPGNLTTDGEKSCYPNSSLPGFLGATVHTFFHTCTILILIYTICTVA